jgi:hypothetical protein
MVLFRLPGENAAGDYKRGHYRKKQPKLNLLHVVCPSPQHHFNKGYRY